MIEEELGTEHLLQEIRVEVLIKRTIPILMRVVTVKS